MIIFEWCHMGPVKRVTIEIFQETVFLVLIIAGFLQHTRDEVRALMEEGAYLADYETFKHMARLRGLRKTQRVLAATIIIQRGWRRWRLNKHARVIQRAARKWLYAPGGPMTKVHCERFYNCANIKHQ
jgi:hypothetical protein